MLLALTVSFAAIDTTLSLDPQVTSSVYGMLTGAGMALLALAVAVLLSLATTQAETRGDLGRLLLALAILWIYLDFMQLLIFWQSDLASEAPWYLARLRGFWGAVRIATVLGHFVVPFCLLLSPRLRRSRRVLAGLAALLIATEVLNVWWLVLPSLGLRLGWQDLACVLGVGGLGLAAASWTSRAALGREPRNA